jgi:hypothetical protein
MKRTWIIWLALIAVIEAGVLDFPNFIKEVHAPADAKTVTADFEFTNRSDKPVSIAKYDSGCSCLAVTIRDGKLRYEPGESGVVRSVFSMGNFSGSVDKIVALWLDNDPMENPSLKLTVRVHIPVLVAMEPKTLKWDLGGKLEPKVIQIRMNHDKPIHVTSVTSTSEAFKHELKTIEDGKSYELVVTPTETESPGLGIFRVETDCDLEKHRIQQAFASVRRPSPSDPAVKP